MKTMYLILATLTVLGLASCSSNENDLFVETISTNALVSTYGAVNVSESSTQSENIQLTELPAMSVTEVYTILGDIRNHEASEKESRAYEGKQSGKSLVRVEMIESVSNKYTFLLQLNLTKYADGTLYYSGYESNCLSNSFKWYMKGFSFSCDNSQAGCYKFETQSFLYFKVVDNGIQYLKVPFKVVGTYNPSTQNTTFSYSL